MKKCVFHLKTAFFSRIFKILQNFGVFWNGNFEKLGLEEITEIVDLVKRFPMSIWLEKSASIQPRTSLLKFEDHRSQFRSHTEPLVVLRKDS